MFENNDYFDFNITNYCNASCPTCKRYSMPVNPHVKNEVKEFLIQNRVHMNFDDFKKKFYISMKICSLKKVLNFVENLKRSLNASKDRRLYDIFM